MKYIMIGTAGHVDHGKSALIKALTGIDTDRLQEEKVRGISIDLGFAPLELSADLGTDIVDVPGHQRFLKNMLAGTGGIDLAMLVIAADEGIMPQTREHLAMLQLYGIQHGIVVINKIDKVDAEWLELIHEEVATLVQETFLDHSPVCPVSSTTGAGLVELKEKLLTVAQQVIPRDSEAPFRMWIDRVFTMKGYGVVVTGSVLSGTIQTGDSLRLYPANQQVRVRGLECHGHKVEKIMAGQRAAINLVGVEKNAITRGMSLTTENYGQISNIWDIAVEWSQPMESGTRVRLHLGTSEMLGRIYSFKDSSQQYMRLILEEDLAGSPGDKGIIRLYSPQYLLGGITLIAPNKGKKMIGEKRLTLAQSLLQGDVYNIVYDVLRDSGSAIPSSEIMCRTGYVNKVHVEESLRLLLAENKIIMLDQFYITQEELELLTNRCQILLASFHQEQPARAGLSREIIRQKLNLVDKFFDKVVSYWQKSGSIMSYEGYIALPVHGEKYNSWCQELLNQSAGVSADPGLTHISSEVLAVRMGLLPSQAKVAFDLLVSKGMLIQLESICIYATTMQYIINLIHQNFQKNQGMTVAQVRDLLNTSRKITLSILEYLDMHNYTIRDGDERRPGLKIIEFSEK